jgi:Fe-S-cluster containining protein
MAGEIDFQCQKCAACCRSLLETRNEITRGLPLTESESHLFPKETISPKLGVGKTEPERIVLYQLNVNCCPFVSERNECQIYSKRPLMCQSFPIVAGAISNRCRIFSYRKPGVKYQEPFCMNAQVIASTKLEKYIQSRINRHKTTGLKIWEFDFSAGKWHLTEK